MEFPICFCNNILLFCLQSCELADLTGFFVFASELFLFARVLRHSGFS